MKRLVADTGPLLHLHEAGALSLFPLIGEVTFPPIVFAELCAQEADYWSEGFPSWARQVPLSSAAQARASGWQQGGLLHPGEAGALALAEEIQPDWFLTDDAAARLMADTLGIEAHGSLGVLLWAAAKGLVTRTEAEAHLGRLERSSLWLSARVRSEARNGLAKLFETNKD